MSEIVDSLSSITETSDVFIIQNGGNIIENNNLDKIFSFDIFFYTDYIITCVILLCILTILYIIYANIYTYKYM